MAFNFTKLLSVVKAVSKTNTFNLAGALAFQKIGEEIDKHANNPAVVKAIAKELITEAPALVGAIAKNTPAQDLVPVEDIHPG